MKVCMEVRLLKTFPVSNSMGTEGDSQGVKRLGLEADQSPLLVPRSRMVELYLSA
jgi:hypothetical protein